MQATTATARAGRTGLLPGNRRAHSSFASSIRSISATRTSVVVRPAGTLTGGRPVPCRPIGQDGAVRTVEEHQAVVAALLPPLPGGDGRRWPTRTAGCWPGTSPRRSRCPGFDNSAMDGYAARWAEVVGSADARSRLPVAEDIPAGRTDVVPLAPGTVQRIMTGAPLPPGADVVVPVELTDGGTDVVEIRDVPRRRHPPARRRRGHRRGRGRAAGRRAARRRAAGPGRRRGRHDAAGPPAARGSSSSPPAASSSRPGQPLLPGQIYESNSQLLVAAVEDAGGEARRLHFVPDDVDQFLATVRAERGRRPTC